MGQAQQIERKITLRGISDIMFDRYAGDNKTELPVERKMYLAQDGKSVVLPAANIMSFLTAQNTPSAPKRLLDPRQYKRVAQDMMSYLWVTPFEIPFTREDGTPIVFNGFKDDQDAAAGMYVHRSVARLEKGIPNPKIRPVLRCPWILSFTLTIYPNDVLKEDLVVDMFRRGGIALGLGTFRGVFGKFVLDKWE